jgi:hypothetical protein
MTMMSTTMLMTTNNLFDRDISWIMDGDDVNNDDDDNK